MIRKKVKRIKFKRILARGLVISLCLCFMPIQAEAGWNNSSLDNFDINTGKQMIQDKLEENSNKTEFNISTDQIHITDKEKSSYFYVTFLPEDEVKTTLEMQVEDDSIIQVKDVNIDEVTDRNILEDSPRDAQWYKIEWKSKGQTKIHLTWNNVTKDILVIAKASDDSESIQNQDQQAVEEGLDSLNPVILVTPGWVEKDGAKYYINVDGTKAKGFAFIQDVLYYFDEDTGVLHQKAGWIIKEDEQYFCNESGEVYRNMFIHFADTYYYMGDDGALQKGVIDVEGALYYADENTGIVKRTSGWIHSEDGKDYFAADGGILYQNRFISFGNTYYYMGIDGSVQKGIFKIGIDWYYADPNSGEAKVTEGWITYGKNIYYSQVGGKLYSNQFAQIKDKDYCFAEDASLYKGTFIFNGNKYHANSQSGEIKFEAGWIHDNGESYFANSEGIIYFNQFISFGNTQYYTGEDGSIQKGVFEVKNTLYYADEKTGIIQKSSGWIIYNNKQYYANSQGVLYRDQLITFGDIWYYMGADGSVQTGVVSINNVLYFADLRSGIIQKSAGWITDGEKKYFAKEGGELYHNTMISFGSVQYYMGRDGSVQKGVIKTENGVYYADPVTGVIINREQGWFVDEQGKKYFVGPDGKFYSNQFISFGNTQYYMGEDGSVQTGVVKAINDKLYYAKKYFVGPDGKFYSNQFISFGNTQYYMGEDGSVQTGVVKAINDKLYYADPNQFISFGNTQYYMGEDGSVQTGVVKAINDKLYYADPKTGIIQKQAGWITYKNKEYFSDENGQLYHNRLISFGVTQYYMGQDGSLQKGIIEINGQLYFAGEIDGVIKTSAGWIDYNSKRYFANEKGILYRNQFITFGLNTYYMDSDGSMVKGNKYINGVWYTFNEKTGLLERKTGWFTSGSNKYYQKADGTLAKGYTDIDGVRYYFDSTGALASKMGIDVSQWQGNINWSEVKKAGVEFAMIRVGYRGSAAAGKLMADPYYKQNIEGALAAGIKVGVYFFSQAITVQEAKEEAQFTYNLIKDYNITYPVAFDSEYYNSDRDGRADYLSATQRTLMANTFCIEMQRLGYKPMVYASTSFFQTDLQLSMLTKWQLWVAQYNTVITHKGSYQCWQYTSTGKVNGINGNVDMNVWIN